MSSEAINNDDDKTSNESADFNNVANVIDTEATIDKVNETSVRNKRKEIPINSAPSKLLQYESYSDNIVHDDGHVCPECNSAFSTKENMKPHLRDLHPKFKLTNHVESIHQRGYKKFKCEQCSYTSAYSGDVKQHTKDLLENIRDNICEECGYATSRKDYLKKHIEAVHKNMKNHVCGQCKYATSEKCNLNTHIKSVHEKIRDHVCEKCGYAASQKGALEQHIKAVH